ncbi:VCBS domain-containing protein [Sansalvadorimonas verongulae]|uniref:VCBS domain-containing protein n=1 Tax=Sansalvadorimonas verongulae TaxID=2172824 RepID=UPI0012BBE0FB|nr:VCBS domain-containing protein [Sansalvadorimonas verongulae]MTI15315.1 type I secretion C-terminal target domain-containing protein [Sansalvadorimonas verongulae]
MMKVGDISGTVFAVSPDGSKRMLVEGATLQPDDTVQTSDGSNVVLVSSNGQMVTVPANMTLPVPQTGVPIHFNMFQPTPAAGDDTAAESTPDDAAACGDGNDSSVACLIEESATSDLLGGGSAGVLHGFGSTPSVAKAGGGLDDFSAFSPVKPSAPAVSSQPDGFTPLSATSAGRPALDSSTDSGAMISGVQVMSTDRSEVTSANADSVVAITGQTLSQQSGVLANDTGEGIRLTHLNGSPVNTNGTTTLDGNFGTLTVWPDGRYTYDATEMDLHNDLVAYWNFNQNVVDGIVSDQATVDSYANPGRLERGASITDGGVTGGALDGHLSIKESPELNIPLDGSVEARTVNLSFQMPEATLEGERQVLYQEGDASTGGIVYIIDDMLYAGAYNGSDWSGSFLSVNLSGLNGWHNVTVALDGDAGTMNAWLDGQLFGQTSSARGLDSHDGDIGVGGSSGATTKFHDGHHSGNFTFTGLIDDVRVYNRALNEVEAKALAEGAAPNDQFNYTIQSASGSVSTSTLTVSVQAPDNTAPVAENDALTVMAGQSVAVNSAAVVGLLGNDRDLEGDTLTVTDVGGTVVGADGTTTIDGQYGTLIISADGTYAYTPSNGVRGGVTDTFSYTVSDGTTTSTATLSVNILAQGHANADSLSISESGWSPATVFVVDYDADNDSAYLRAYDLESGVSYVLGDLQGAVQNHGLELAVSPSGEIYAVDNSRLYSLDPETLQFSEIGNHGVSHFPQYDISGLAFSPDGTLYMYDTSGEVNTINLTTGQATSLGSLEDQGYENITSDSIAWHDGALYALTAGLGVDDGGSLIVTESYLVRIDITDSGLVVTEPAHERDLFYLDTLASVGGELVGVLNTGQSVVLDTVNGGIKEFGDIVQLQDGGSGSLTGMRTMAGNVLDNDTNPQAVSSIQLPGGSSHSVTSNGTTIRGTFGFLTIRSDGSYEYQVDDRLAATNNLATGETGTDRFTYTSTDINGQPSQSVLTVYVNGQDEQDVAESALLTSSITMESVDADNPVPVDFTAQASENHRITEIHIRHHKDVVFNIPDELLQAGTITGNDADSFDLIWTANPGTHAGLEVFDALSSGLTFTTEDGDFVNGFWMRINITSSGYDADGNLTDALPAITTIQTNYVDIDHTRMGTDGNDTLTGSSESQNFHDEFIGGAGNDTMTGGDGSDFYVWRPEDVGTGGSPAVDTITDFNAFGHGDVLDLRDLLPDGASENLDQYLSFNVADGDTTINVSTSAGGPVVQQIVLQDVDLTVRYGTTDSASLVNNLTDNGNLIS